MYTRITESDVKCAADAECKAGANLDACNAAYERHYDDKKQIRMLLGKERDAAIDAYEAESDRLTNIIRKAQDVNVVQHNTLELMRYTRVRQAASVVADALVSSIGDLAGKRADYKRTHAAIWRAIEAAGLSINVFNQSSTLAYCGGFSLYITTDSYYGPYIIMIKRDDVKCSFDIAAYDDTLTISEEIVRREAARLEKWRDITAADCTKTARTYQTNRKKAAAVLDKAEKDLKALAGDFSMWGLDTDCFHFLRIP